VDLRTVLEVPGPLGEHSKGKTTIYFLTCALCAALQPMFCHLFSKTSGPFFQKLLQNSKKQNAPNQKKHKKMKISKMF